jgi:hypothetical protein
MDITVVVLALCSAAALGVGPRAGSLQIERHRLECNVEAEA